MHVCSTCFSTWFYLWSKNKSTLSVQRRPVFWLIAWDFISKTSCFYVLLFMKDEPLTFDFHFSENVNLCSRLGQEFFRSLLLVNWMSSGFQRNGHGFYCGFFSFGAPVQQLLPAFTKTEPGHRGKTSCFVLAALLLKDLERSLSHLLATRSASSRLLCFLPFSSPQVLSNLSPGEKWKVCGSLVSWVFLCVFLHLCMCLCVCVHVSPCDSVCALFKATVSKAYKAPRV